MSQAVVVFGAAALTAVATGLGALPFALVRAVSDGALAWAKAVAAGLMLGASFGLVAEGTEYGGGSTLMGIAAGVVFIFITQRWLGHHEVTLGQARSGGGRQAVLMVVVMTVHSFAEGVAVGVSFGGGVALATPITLAIAVHNVPEGLAVSAVLRPHGASVLRCAAWSIFSSLPQPIMAVPAFMLVEAARVALPYGLGFAAGAMVYLVLVELLPEALDGARRPAVALLVSTTMVGMALFQRWL